MNNPIVIVSDIFKNIPFTQEEASIIYSKIRKIDLKKGAILIKPGQKVLNQYYVLDGCLRSFYFDELGKEHTVQFAIHDWWITDYTSFFMNKPSIMSIEVIQNATVYELSKIDLESLYTEIPKIESFFRIKMERAFASFQKRILENLASPAKEKYLSFIKTYPNIEKSVKKYHIASYLGITSESLSRIRKSLKLT